MSCLIFDSGESSTQQEIIKRLFPEENIDFSGEAPVWDISNKYYQAKVQLQVFKKSSKLLKFEPALVLSKTFLVGASVFFAEAFTRNESWALLDSWRMFVLQKLKNSDSEDDAEDDDGPEVKLLVVGNFESEDVKNSALQWALKHGNGEGVEIVDFSEEDEDDNTEGLTCASKSGPKRVVEALQACLWNDLVGDEQEPSGDGKSGKSNEPECSVTTDEMDDFETLFAQFATFKSASENLSEEDRKAFAEKVALSFYKSLGGGDSENECDSSLEN